MASPFDSVNAPSPASYSAPNLAALLYAGIGGLPQDYFQGTQQGRTLQQQNLFKNGLPTDANGQPDINAISQALIKTGGAEQAQALLPFLFKQQFLAQENAGDQQPVNRAPTTGQSPEVLTRAAGGGGAQGVTQTNGGDTLNSLAAERGIDLNGFLTKYPGFKPLLDRDLTPAQAQTVTSRMQAFKGGGGGPISSGEITQGNEQVGSGGGPVGGVGGAPISPAPTAAAGSDTFNQRFGAATGGAAGMVPQGADPRSFAFALKKSAEADRSQARREGIAGFPVKALEDKAAAKDKQADAILEQLGKAGELTTEQKNLASGTTERAAQGAADIKFYDTVHKGLVGSGQVAAAQKQNLDVLRQIAASPSFTPGTGSDLWRAYQRALAQFGVNPTSAAPREIFDQVAAKILANQFDGIKSVASEIGEQGARIFKPMLDIEEKANITPTDSLEGIKAKIDLFDKTGDLMIKWADKADDYKIAHGRLDPGFMKELRADIAKARVPNVVPQAAPAGKSDAQGWREIAPGVRIREKPGAQALPPDRM